MRPLPFLLTAAMTVLGVSALTGCAVPAPAVYGSFVHEPLNLETLARDAARQVGTIYPAAKTRFTLQHPAADDVGMAIVAALRGQGYAVQESAPGKADRDTSGGSAVTGNFRQGPAFAETEVSLRYVFDQTAGSGNGYRLTIFLGERSLTRAYIAENGTLAPTGYWTLLEGPEVST